ncbi:hypothetical protein D3C74_329680 [compost metagenome]
MLGGVGQPRVDREERCLDREREEEREEQQPLGAHGQRVRRQVVDQGLGQEALLPARPVEVERDDPDEHDEPAREREEQELHGRVPPLRPAPEPADHEVDRDQHGLEQDVEEEHVAGHEDRDHERLEEQHQAQVVAELGEVAVLLAPGGEHHERDQQHREPDQQERDAVRADRVAHAELRDPRVRLGELERARVRRVERADREAQEHELGEAEHDRHGPQVLARRRGAQAPDRSRTDERQDDQECQPGNLGGHRSLSSLFRWSRRGPPRRSRSGQRASSPRRT